MYFCGYFVLFIFFLIYLKLCKFAKLFCGCGVMAAAPDLESGAERRVGSSPSIRTVI